MRDPLILELRRAAAAPLPGRAFLKRDRDEALFVSDAPRVCPGTDWTGPMAEAGFTCETAGGLLRLWPDAIWLSRLEARFPEPPDALCASLARFRGLPWDGECLALFALGARCLDGEPDTARFDRRLRQHAAACLRKNRTNPDDPPRGGGLYACALLRRALIGGKPT